MKDIPQSSERTPTVVIAGALPRDPIVDAFITRTGVPVSTLPQGSVVGSSSPRRQAFLQRLYPHLRCAYFRGSADTRIEKLDAGEVDAVMLALAGLQRIGCEARVTELTNPEMFLPAIGAGVVTMDCLEHRLELRKLIEKVSDPNTITMVSAERAFIDGIQGSCHTAVAGYSHLHGEAISMVAAVLSPDGKEILQERQSAARSDAKDLGARLALRLLERGAGHLLQPV
jgi:hydroxymethylbilane synthase